MKTLLFVLLIAFLVCFQAQNIDECETKVTQVRKLYGEVTRERRVSLARNVFEEIQKKHTDAKPVTIAYFMARLFSNLEAKRVCDLYKELFETSEEKTEKTEDKNSFIECLRKCVNWQTAARIILKCTEQSDFGKCVLDELTGEAKQCVLNCLGKSEEPSVPEPTKEIVSTPKTDKNNFIDCLRKCVRWQTAVRIIIKCTEQSDFGKCVLDELTGEAKQCVLNCLDQSKSVSYETDCAEKVTKAREHFKKLSTEDKKTFLFAIAKKIIDKHPNVKKENVRVFLVALFGSTDEGEKVCELYKKNYLKQKKKKIIVNVKRKLLIAENILINSMKKQKRNF